ncbi:MAG: DNA-processing protein DprA [Prevotellaceae bacterium]|nr:DNA-processing protein DprA [Prevotellaceae bacterium]
MNNDLLYQIALTLVPGVGSVTAKKLIAYSGSAEAVFKLNKSALQKIPNIGRVTAGIIVSSEVLKKAEKELMFVGKHNIRALSFLDDEYPERLKNCDDGPVVLYIKGNAGFNIDKVISIVGTRRATTYGKELCERLIKGFMELRYYPLIISGLAYGIDICAHKMALKYNLPTAAVLGHGLDTLYPAQHRNIAIEMLKQEGALLSDFTSGSAIDPANFVRRNRIVAGMADATIIVESAEKGGSLITAGMAFDYNRDVLAFPGRVGDKSSAGCNKLIRINRAALIESAADVAYALNWNSPEHQSTQLPLFNLELSENEQCIVDSMKDVPNKSIDDICRDTGLTVAVASAVLLSLEFNGLVRTLPGKSYAIVR